MKQLWIRQPLCAFVLALSLWAAPACRSRESDGDILTEISNRMHADPSLRRIKAAVDRGVVTLTGTCTDEPCRQHAADTIRNIQGVKEVVNKISVATP